MLPVQVLKASAKPLRPRDLHSKGNFSVMQRVTFERNNSLPPALLFPSSQVYITRWTEAFTFFLRARRRRGFLKKSNDSRNFKIEHSSGLF